MVLYVVEIDFPTGKPDEASAFLAPHVAKGVALLGRDAVGRRARVRDDGRLLAAWETGSVGALESYLASHEREELALDLERKFPGAKVVQHVGEQAGAPRRGMRMGEEPGAALVIRAELPAVTYEDWARWYDQDHIPEVLRDRGFVRARRFELHGLEEGTRGSIVIYDAVDTAAVEAYRADAGARLAQEHEQRFPMAKLRRSVWEWLA